ncbi:MAG: flagellar hook assembly protein FlgD [Alphaproteobacteria bacterium]|nr:flagellar hook assembly protein FlgD [Alphaproteobacteria bacterium]
MDVTQAGAAAASASTKASASLAKNFDTFLTLLTAQLRNQDPLKPLDSNEFTKQLVDFSQVEQSIAQNKNLETLIGLAQSNASGALVSYLGRQATLSSAETKLASGAATWSYALPAAAKDSFVSITDATGRLVYAGKGETAAGAHQFVWDGKDNAGTALPDGTYKLTVSAHGLDGKALAPALTVAGLVEAVSFADGKARLVVNGNEYDPDEVLSVAP